MSPQSRILLLLMLNKWDILCLPEVSAKETHCHLIYSYWCPSSCFVEQFNFRFSRGHSCRRISHLLFADDSLMFLKAVVSEMHCLLDVLNAYGVASGQLVSMEKSSVLFSPNVIREVTRELLLMSNLRKVEYFDNYLGVPTWVGRCKSIALGFIK